MWNKSRYIGDDVYCKTCEKYCGHEYALRDGALYEAGTEKVYCSDDCRDNDQPVYCSECHDVRVEKKGSLCQYCTIEKEQGAEAAEAWLEAQLPPKKPPMPARYGDVNKDKQGGGWRTSYNNIRRTNGTRG
jgi:hypothetical protein